HARHEGEAVDAEAAVCRGKLQFVLAEGGVPDQGVHAGAIHLHVGPALWVGVDVLSARGSGDRFAVLGDPQSHGAAVFGLEDRVYLHGVVADRDPVLRCATVARGDEGLGRRLPGALRIDHAVFVLARIAIAGDAGGLVASRAAEGALRAAALETGV